MPWYPPELENLHAVAVGTLTLEGVLVEANEGLLELVRTDGSSSAIGTIISHQFVQPSFATIISSPGVGDIELYSGLLTLGADPRPTHCLLARIWRTDGEVRIVAEHNVRELLRLNETVLELNREATAAHLAAAQANLRLQQRGAEIRTLSLTDQLTGVGNRRRLEQALVEEISRAERSGGKLSVLMVDLDYFKHVNDTYGHLTGDRVLKVFADILRANTRPTDVLGRYGGEEFVVVMPNTGQHEAIASAERLRTTLASTLITPLAAPITMSVGVVEFRRGESGEDLLHRSDEALYAAKRDGRNQVLAA